MFNLQICKRFTGNIFCVCNYQRIHCSRPLLENYYETLRVKYDSSPREIRNAYLKLSKEYHPDHNSGDKTKHEKFLEISEAYNVLSKPHLRHEYDMSIAYGSNKDNFRSDNYDNPDTDRMWKRTWGHPVFYHNRKDLDYNAKDDEYYGVKGVRRISNRRLVSLLIIFSFASFIVQMMFIRYAAGLRQRRADENDAAISKSLEELEDAAKLITTEEYLENLEHDYNENLKKYRGT